MLSNRLEHDRHKNTSDSSILEIKWRTRCGLLLCCDQVQERMLSQKTCASFCARCSELRPTDRHTHHRHKRPTMTDRPTDRHTELTDQLKEQQKILDFHLLTYARTQETMTDHIKEMRLVSIGAIHQKIIDIKRKLRAIQATLFPPPPPTKGEYDMTMIYTPTFGDTDHE